MARASATADPDRVLALVALAAGASRRFGTADKLLAEVDGEALVSRSIRRLRCVADSMPLATIRLIAVVPDLDGPVAAVISRVSPTATLVANPHRDLGLGTSVAAGIAAVPHEACGALVTPCDLPDLEPAFVVALLMAFLETGCDRPVHASLPDGTPVSPMVWPRRLFAGLLALECDAGGRHLLAGERPVAHGISARQALDIDTVADLARRLPTP
ncbi:MAG: NTP transferase domain-containing protein [Hyphomicrobium aestuarii]|nr:NTP transferase domain-containing protein [Hyphomicrobium aestuarii]